MQTHNCEEKKTTTIKYPQCQKQKVENVSKQHPFPTGLMSYIMCDFMLSKRSYLICDVMGQMKVCVKYTGCIHFLSPACVWLTNRNVSTIQNSNGAYTQNGVI